ncbi:hypothetical protein ABIB57_003088 [Devosia sp. UYZn731]|uniref:hypothetical protein n=1 Tax=Devosia sp. UYZn731 TaxID=3156345 RepID=UPI003391B97B
MNTIGFRYPLVVNAESTMAWPMFLIGPVVLIVALTCCAAIAATATVGGYAAAYLSIFAMLPCFVMLMSGLGRVKLGWLRNHLTAAAAIFTLLAPLVLPALASLAAELQTLWFVLSYGVSTAAAAAFLSAPSKTT